MQKVFSGKIWTGEYRDNYSALMVGYTSTPFAKIWEEEFWKKPVTVRYWISETEKTKDQLKENHLATLSGSIDADYSDKYSDYTGYLWTDETLKVGGHDLLRELYSHVGKFLYLEVDY
jgi:hypothetical protein